MIRVRDNRLAMLFAEDPGAANFDGGLSAEPLRHAPDLVLAIDDVVRHLEIILP